MSDNWPKHPDGTNMTVGEMSEEDRKRILREATERYKARCDGGTASKKIIDAMESIVSET